MTKNPLAEYQMPTPDLSRIGIVEKQKLGLQVGTLLLPITNMDP
jgi:hypothetical protein